MHALKPIFISFVLALILVSAAKANFWQDLQRNVSKAFTPSRFICDKYEVQEYEVPVLRPGVKLPYTEKKRKQRKCKRWVNAPSSALGKACAEYEYVNTSPKEQKAFYQMVKRKRTVCIEGHSTR